MKKFALFIGFLTVAFLGATSAYGSYGSVACQPVYGGGETCATTDKIILDKKVLDPASGTKGKTEAYVDNLSINDGKYSPLSTVKFQIVVTNVSSSKLAEVSVTDALPSYVEFVSGAGTYDNGARSLTFKILNLNPNESRKFIIEAKVVDSPSLPNGQGVVCVVNQASAVINGSEAKDNSQFCIEKTVTTKGGLPVMEAPKMKQTPATGPEMFSLLGLIPAGLAGFFLRKRTSK